MHPSLVIYVDIITYIVVIAMQESILCMVELLIKLSTKRSGPLTLEVVGLRC